MNTTRRMVFRLSLLTLIVIPLLPSSMQAQVTVGGRVASFDGTAVKADLTLIRGGSAVEIQSYHTDSQGAFSIETNRTTDQLLVAKANGYVSSVAAMGRRCLASLRVTIRSRFAPETGCPNRRF